MIFEEEKVYHTKLLSQGAVIFTSHGDSTMLYEIKLRCLKNPFFFVNKDLHKGFLGSNFYWTVVDKILLKKKINKIASKTYLWKVQIFLLCFLLS